MKLLPNLASLLPRPALVSLTGGGGKTSLLYGLGKYLAAQDEKTRVLLATTTKIAIPHDAAIELLLGAPLANAIQELHGAHRLPLVGGGVANGKVTGVDPAHLDGLMASGVADYIVVEADGAKMLPFKAYAPHEPVIPASATVQIVVIGAEMLIEPPGEGNTFRRALLRERWGDLGDASMPFDLLARILESENEYLKGAIPASKKILLINKCDLLAREYPDRLAEAAKELSSRLTRYDYFALASIKENRLYALSHLREDNHR